MKIIYNADRLIGLSSKTPARSGVFFCSISILKEFEKTHKVILYTDHRSWASIKFNKEFSHYEIIDPKNPLAKICSFGYYIRTQLDPYRKYRVINILCKTITYSMILLDNFFKNYLDQLPDNNKYCFFSSYTNTTIQTKKIPVFTLLHDAIPFTMKEYAQEQKAFLRQIVKNFDKTRHYFANSQYTKDDFLRFFPDKLDKNKIKVTHLGASSGFYYDFDINKNNKIKDKYHLPKDKKYIFSLCTLEPRKNLLFVIENFIKLIEKENIEDVIFVLGGGYRDGFLSKLQEVIGKHQDKIIHIGYVDDEDLSSLFSHSLCSIYLSLYEGFGLPVLESMQCGCPIIASNTTSIPEIVADAGILIDPKDASALQNAILQIYQNPLLGEELRQKGLQRAKEFSWQKCAKEMLEYMQEVLQTQNKEKNESENNS